MSIARAGWWYYSSAVASRCRDLSSFPSVSRRRNLVSSLAMAMTQQDVNGSQKRKLPPKVGTHNGTFHCDEALGCFLIRLTHKFSDAEIVRTRDPKVLSSLDAVLDVGGVYDFESYRFDHHQRGFEHTFGHGFATKLSSAGLVYKHFGLEIIAKKLGVEQTHEDAQRVYVAMYKNFIEGIDAVDNGISQYETDKPSKYEINTNLSARVGRLNPDWTEKVTEERENEAFSLATQLAGGEFLDTLHYHIKSWLPARVIVADYIRARESIDASGEIIYLQRYCPWKEHIFDLEQDLLVEPTIKFVLYQDERNLQWRVQAVAVGPGRFESRKPLPEAWRGLRDENLSQVADIEGCVFVHSSGFIGGHISFEGVLEMARKALAN